MFEDVEDGFILCVTFVTRWSCFPTVSVELELYDDSIVYVAFMLALTRFI